MSNIDISYVNFRVQKKHLAQVLAVPSIAISSYETGVHKSNVDEFERFQPLACFVPRWFANKTLTFRQLIGYVYFTRVVNGIKQVFVYQRTKKVGEERLGGLYSIGFGGHVELSDVDIFTAADGHSFVDFMTTLAKSTERELGEEVGVSHESLLQLITNSFAGSGTSHWIVDNENDVGQAHLGLAIEISVDSLGMGIEPNVLEEELKAIGWLDVADLKNPAADLGYEPWTKLLAKVL